MNTATPRGADLRAAWHSLRRTGFVVPELPTVVFVAVATGAGFGWGLGCGVAALAAVVIMRIARSMPLRTMAGGVVGLTVATVIARLTGVAANGLITDMVIDLGISGVLLVSVLTGRPLFGSLWRGIYRIPRTADRATVRAYLLTTALAGGVLLTRGLAMTAVFLAGGPVGWLLAVRIGLGPPGTLVVIAACYAAGGLERPVADRPRQPAHQPSDAESSKEQHGFPHRQPRLSQCPRGG
ncbi:DUF3159 domain-containing protein [Nakamurella lactea]|uniref:DUF3159 domain-containing protein n=1 Tax=Nakamurella lactea TaxID=459515 RepID=UPI00041B150B|nr:DUF3159 domain-containing protein [Nakamurella lactea]